MAANEQSEPILTQVSCKLSDYVTYKMLCVLSILFLVVFMLKDTFSASFMANIWLNGVIVGLIVYAVFVAFKNNIDLWRSACYLRQIERVEQNPNFEQAHVATLIKGLNGIGSIFDMQNTYQVLKKMADTGFFCVNDLDSRLIKSKLGARVRNKRTTVAFYASILVTLGLIGTFWGLILTITAVGKVLLSVSAGISAGEEMEIGALISGISEPLGGMGVAFSSSLFGLGGSLMLVLLNFLGGMSQDRFMEQAARWLDEHIPSMNPSLIHKSKDAVKKITAAPKQDMEALLGAYVVLSQDTHVRLRALTGEFSDIKSIFGSHQDLLRRNLTQQELLNAAITKLAEQSEMTEGHLSRLNKAQDTIAVTLNKQIEAFNNGQLKLGETFQQSSSVVEKSLKTSSDLVEKSLQQNSAVVERSLQKNAVTVQSALEQKSHSISEQLGEQVKHVTEQLKAQIQHFEGWTKHVQTTQNNQENNVKYQQNVIEYLQNILLENNALQKSLVQTLETGKDTESVNDILDKLEVLAKKLEREG